MSVPKPYCQSICIETTGESLDTLIFVKNASLGAQRSEREVTNQGIVKIKSTRTSIVGGDYRSITALPRKSLTRCLPDKEMLVGPVAPIILDGLRGGVLTTTTVVAKKLPLVDVAIGVFCVCHVTWQ